ncbi:LytR/AlgR family response regulator transcription factor [Ottowia thiooxydans]|uniref:LytR/AlgR family response regulator transcription factor n=1 Tax=Ottowia thiooxydans TaxID=219182 RepID=UPI00041AA3A8|nr:LytTR family DNA-binding domain-containing protein [Ottowia thiooxydans]
MALKVLIVDDEALARSRLRTLLGDCRQPDALVAGEAANASQALALVQHQTFDVVLLDVQMPGADGIQLAEALRQLPEPPMVIFVTAHAGYAVNAFELDAVDYLTKPVRLERLQAALHKAQRMGNLSQVPQADSGPEWLLIAERGRTVRIPLSEVRYLKAELKYVTVRTPHASHLFDGSLSQLEERHPGRFLRIHRNTLVARSAIRELMRHQGEEGEEAEGWAVRLADAEELLVVSRRQVAAVREALGE